MRSAIAAYRKGHTLWTYIIQGIQIIGILLFSALIVFLVRRLFQSIRRYISVEQEKLIKGIAIKNVSLLTREKQHRLTLQLIGVLQIVVYLAVFYFTLPFLFNVFPWTRSLSNTLVFWIVSPLKKVGTAALLFLPNLFSIAVIVVITQGLIKVAKKLFDEIEKGTLKFHGFYQDWAKPTFNIVRFILYVLMFVMVFPYLPGSDSPIFRGVSVFLGLLFSLGSTSAISNIVAGLVITYMRPFKNGDRIRIGEVVGDVIEKNMLVTRIQTIKNEIITLPNSTILTGHTVNYSINGENLRLILHTTVTIGYDVPWKTVHALLIDAAKRTGGVTQNPEPFVLQKSLNDFYVSYEINAYTESPAKMALIYSELHQNIQDCFTAAKVEIMSPHYLALRDSTGSRAEKPA
ncbi:MAG: mechanosensitive ion channel family protein [Chitinispirillaceae bacterium]|nr:mechanosensitive ion channel family protein [Chitinispirillaceae bacterium]